MWASIIAVFGTLSGGVVTGLVQDRLGRAARREARADQHREAQLQAVTALAKALADHRRTMWLRENARLDGAAADRLESTREAVHATRSAVTAPWASVCVLVPALAAAATEAAETTYDLRNVPDRDALDTARVAAAAAIDRFITTAGEFFQWPDQPQTAAAHRHPGQPAVDRGHEAVDSLTAARASAPQSNT